LDLADETDKDRQATLTNVLIMQTTDKGNDVLVQSVYLSQVTTKHTSTC